MDLRNLIGNDLRRCHRTGQLQEPQQSPPQDHFDLDVDNEDGTGDLLGMPELTPYSKRGGRGEPTSKVDDLHVSPTPSIINSTRSNSSRMSMIRRRERDLELRKQEELAKIEEEFEAAARERKRKLTEKRYENEKADFRDEMEEDENGSLTSHSKAVTQHPQHIHAWLENLKPSCSPPPPDKMIPSEPTQMDELLQGLGKIINAASTKDNSSDMKIWMARQTMGKDLPTFSGRPEEWPTFQLQFQSVSDACKYTPQINMMRLQKALRGPAKDAVQAMMYSPDNLELVMRTLKQRFGSPELIIEILIDKAKGTSSPKESDLNSLITFSNAVMNLAMTMESLQRPHHLHNPQLVKELVRKLPSNLRLKWGEKVSTVENYDVNIQDFAVWMESLAKAATFVREPFNYRDEEFRDNMQHHQQQRRPEKKRDVMFTAVNRGGDTKKESSCTFCEVSGHIIFKCTRFLQMDVEKRWDWVSKNKACFSCLRKGHQVGACKSKRTCEKDGCDKRHNTLLHKDAKPYFPNSSEPMLHTVGPARTGRKVILRMAPVVLKGPLGEIETIAVFDECCTCTILDSSMSKRLGLQGEPDPLSLQWTNGVTQDDVESKRVSLQISAENRNEFFTMTDVRTKKKMELPIQTIDYKKMASKWSHLRQVELGSMKDVQPMILIGQDNIHLTVAREVIEAGKNAPMLTRTKLGWVVHGNVAALKGRVDQDYSLHICDRDEELHQMVKGYWKTDTFGVKVINERPRSKDDIKAQHIFDDTTIQVDGRWETGLLWRNPDVKLPESRNMALRRLYQLEKKLDSNQELAEQYYSKLDEYLTKGYTRMLSATEVQTHGERLWYLPHFAATHPNKPGKIRLVFDAAAKSRGTSLNDVLYTGPDLLNPLVGVLYKFRQGRVAFTGDIQEMFHQILIRKEDLDSQRFLWRGRDRNREPDEMEISVMTFGSACSPFSAQSVKNMNALRFEKEFPEASSDIQFRHYMDDYLKSTDEEATAIRLIKEVSQIHHEGGFKIRSFTSNSPEVLQSIPEDLRAAQSKTVSDQGFAVEKVLGLRWLPDVDKFTFTINLNRAKPEILDGSRTPTKREILRLVMSVFDPLGFVGHLTIKAQILLQQIWKTGVGWDDEIPAVLGQKWMTWISELKRISKVHIPRCYSLLIPTADSIQLHVLCDASEQAFSAVAYFRVQKGEDVEVGFVSSKCKVAPVRQMSIPRLELQAAVLGSRMAHCIQEEHEIPITTTHFWSDSKTVLCWLRAEGRTFKTFVAHRVGEIEELTDISKWHWVPTKLNVADDATRDNIPTDLSPDGRWFLGPDFLKLPESDWPKETETTAPEEAKEEMKEEIVMLISIKEPLLNYNRFSSYLKHVRTMAWVRRFIFNRIKHYRTPNLRTSGELNVDEVNEAEVLVLKESQRLSFPDEMKSLEYGKTKHLSGSSRLCQLSPFIDEEGLIRIDGRILGADVSTAVKYPVIMDNKSQITKLIIQHHHQNSHHQGQEHVLNELRQKYWILNARTAVRSAWSSCQSCKNQRASPAVPEMGVLPEVRVRGYVRPFTHTGVDYFGPMEVTIGRRREKRYGVLFTCLTTRAIHLEIAGSLTTDSCVMAINRMSARRGSPLNLYSDNGTNFHGADNEIRNSIKEFNQEKLSTTMTTKGIQWHFNPPAAPHMGGAWERLVRSVKTALKATLNEQAPKEEVLLTLMLEAESIVNSRPLTHVSVDPKDPESLTPNHFLIGTSSPAQPLGVFDDDDLNLQKKWRKAQRMTDQFWKRWMKEFLPSLIQRSKWHGKVNPVKTGDVVVIADPNNPRNCWPRGIVTATFPGKDGQVRVADVKTAMGIFRRPICKICVLDVFRLGDGCSSNTAGDNVVVTNYA